MIADKLAQLAVWESAPSADGEFLSGMWSRRLRLG